MKSVMAASASLEALARLLPSAAHRIMADGRSEDVPLDETSPRGPRAWSNPEKKFPRTEKSLKAGPPSTNPCLPGSPNRLQSKKGIRPSEAQSTAKAQSSWRYKRPARIPSCRRSSSWCARPRRANPAPRSWPTALLLCSPLSLSFPGPQRFFWLLVLDRELAFALERTITVMVITCPHALGLAVPLVVAVSASLAASNGLHYPKPHGF